MSFKNVTYIIFVSSKFYEPKISTYRKCTNKRPGYPFNVRGPYGALNRQEAFILMTVTSSAELKCFRQKYQQSLQIARKIHSINLYVQRSISLLQIPMSEFSLRVTVLQSLVYPYLTRPQSSLSCLYSLIIYQGSAWVMRAGKMGRREEGRLSLPSHHPLH